MMIWISIAACAIALGIAIWALIISYKAKSDATMIEEELITKAAAHG